MNPKESLCLSAVCVVCAFGLFAVALAPPGVALGDELRGRGEFGIPGLGAGCNTGWTCGGQLEGVACQMCKDPGADVVNEPAGSGWTDYVYGCKEGPMGLCNALPPRKCIVLPGAKAVECKSKTINQWAKQPDPP